MVNLTYGYLGEDATTINPAGPDLIATINGESVAYGSGDIAWVLTCAALILLMVCLQHHICLRMTKCASSGEGRLRRHSCQVWVTFTLVSHVGRTHYPSYSSRSSRSLSSPSSGSSSDTVWSSVRAVEPSWVMVHTSDSEVSWINRFQRRTVVCPPLSLLPTRW